MRMPSIRMVALLGMAACSARHGSTEGGDPPQSLTAPQVTASRYSEADSAAVLAAVVEEIIYNDGIGALSGRRSATAPGGTGDESRVWVRVGWMPKGAWAAPIVARLRSWPWSLGERVVDSTRALAALEDRPQATLRKPFPLELSMQVEFIGDTASVAEYWVWHLCRARLGNMSVLFPKRHLLVRTTSGWRKVGERTGGVADLASCR